MGLARGAKLATFPKLRKVNGTAIMIADTHGNCAEVLTLALSDDRRYSTLPVLERIARKEKGKESSAVIGIASLIPCALACATIHPTTQSFHALQYPIDQVIG